MNKILEALRHIAAALEQQFLNKEEVIRLMLVSAIAGEHMVIIGPPGTAKSALIRSFAKLLDARYFEYLLTRFTEPNELFGPVDIQAFRQGTYHRRTDGMLPAAEIAFCDEIFKANSAILNALLTLLNERKFANGSELMRVPLLSLFAASNEIPNDDALEAIYDRFLLRVFSDNLDGFHFQGLVEKGVAIERAALNPTESVRPLLSSKHLAQLHQALPEYMVYPPDFLGQYKNLVFQIRNEGISLSDRRVVKLLKLFTASALLDGRKTPAEPDFVVLKHIWNNLDQRDILRDIVDPVLEAYYRQNPQAARAGAALADVDALAHELQLVEQLLASGQALSDIQLFSQLRSLNGIKHSLHGHNSSAAKEILKRVDGLLESVFRSSKFD